MYTLGNRSDLPPYGHPFPTVSSAYERKCFDNVSVGAHSYAAQRPADGTRRYIECLEAEVQQLLWQYEGASQLLYQAVFAQQVSKIVMDESAERMYFMDVECKMRGKIEQYLFRLVFGCYRTRSTSDEQRKDLVFNTSQDTSELSQQIAFTLRESLKIDNQRLTQLVEAVPHQVRLALMDSDSQILKQAETQETTKYNSTELQSGHQQPDCTADRSYSVGAHLDQKMISRRSEPSDSGDRVVTLRQPLDKHENSSQCLVVAVRLHMEENDSAAQQEVSSLPSVEARKIEAAHDTPKLSPPVISEDMQCILKNAQRSFDLLESMAFEYTFTLEQMQAIAKEEMKSLISANEHRAVKQWKTLLHEKEAVIFEMKKKLEKIQNLQTSDAKKGKKQNDLPISQLYTLHAAPFIPESLRKTKRVKFQTIGQLRLDAIRVGAKPARFPSSPTNQTDTTPQNSPPTSEKKNYAERSKHMLDAASAGPSANTTAESVASPVSEIVTSVPSVRLAKNPSNPSFPEREESKRVAAPAPLAPKARALSKTSVGVPTNVSDYSAAIRTFKQSSSSSSSSLSSSTSASSVSSPPPVKQKARGKQSLSPQRTQEVSSVAQADLQSAVSSNLSAIPRRLSGAQGNSDIHESREMKKTTPANSKQFYGIQTTRTPRLEKPSHLIASHNSFDDSTASEGDNRTSTLSPALPLVVSKISKIESNTSESATEEPVKQSTRMVGNKKISETSDSLDTTLTLSFSEKSGGSHAHKNEGRKSSRAEKKTIKEVRSFSLDKDRSVETSYKDKSKTRSAADDTATDPLTKLQGIRFTR